MPSSSERLRGLHLLYAGAGPRRGGQHTMLCKEASANGFICVDVYHLMNGPDGAQPLGDLAIDGTHLSQKGNDMIAALLAKVDVSTVGH